LAADEFPAIEIRHLRKQYGRVVAVDDLNLTVPAGAICGLIGPNGAGKTTTLKILATLIAPTSGEAYVWGLNVVREARAVRQVMGYMPDAFGVYNDLKVWEYLDFFAACYGMPEARRRSVTDELLALVDLADKRNEYVDHLSRGMKQRLGLARALINDPKVLLLDEPASGLDPRARVELRELLKELGAMGKTILISSHILAELADMCTHIAVIDHGRLVAAGPVDEFIFGANLRAVLVRVLGPAGPAQQTLERFGPVRVVSENGAQSELLVDLPAEPEAQAEALAALVKAGVRVVSFAERASGLEEVFLQVTREAGG